VDVDKRGCRGPESGFALFSYIEWSVNSDLFIVCTLLERLQMTWMPW
jgi:hypothetical protein